MNIIYTNNNIRLTDFWTWIEGLHPTRPDSGAIEAWLMELDENHEELMIGNFRILLGILSEVRRGRANPIGLRVHLKKRVYLVTPNGDLSLESPSKVNLQTISLDEMLIRIGKR